jgi:hypothetical protein
LDGPSGEFYAIMGTTTTLGGVVVPPFGLFELDVPFVVVFQGVIPASGSASNMVTIPNDQAWVGVDIYLQGLSGDGYTLLFTNTLMETITN